MSWPGLLPGFYLGTTPDLSPGTPLRQVAGADEDAVLHHDELRQRQLHGQDRPGHLRGADRPAGRAVPRLHPRRGASAPAASASPDKPLGKTRATHVDAFGKQLAQTAGRGVDARSTRRRCRRSTGPRASRACRSIASRWPTCSTRSAAKAVGYELDATNVHVPMRIAFERGAARQYGGAWINYASGNFGDACNYFTQKPVVPRGAPGAGSTASTPSPTASASAGTARCTTSTTSAGRRRSTGSRASATSGCCPAPGTHPIQLSPFGRATEDFQAFVDRLPDRGEPYHADRLPAQLRPRLRARQLLAARCCTSSRRTRRPRAARTVQRLLVPGRRARRPARRRRTCRACPAAATATSSTCSSIGPRRPRRSSTTPSSGPPATSTWPARWRPAVEEYVTKGGTLVVNVERRRSKLRRASWLGVNRSGQGRRRRRGPRRRASRTPTTPYEVAERGTGRCRGPGLGDPRSCRSSPATRSATARSSSRSCPQMLGLDERAHPACRT